MIEYPFVAVVKNSKDEYFKSFSYHSGNTWTTDLKKATIFTKISNAHRRVTLIHSWNKHKKNTEPIPEIRQFFISGFVDIDQTERINKAAEKEEKRRAESEKAAALWRKEQAQRDYDRAKAELDRLGKKLQDIQK